MSETIKCDYCGERSWTPYSSEITLKAGWDIYGAEYKLCCRCSEWLRKLLDAGKVSDAD